MNRFTHLIFVFFFSFSISQGQFNSAFEEFLEESMIFLDNEIDPVGLSISVRSGANVWNGAIGISAVNDSLTTSSVLALGSITKTFVSASILKMMEEDKLSLSDPIQMYLPSYEYVDSTITIKELLNHTSGIYNYTNNPQFWDSIFTEQNQFYTYSPEEVLEGFVLDPIFERGTAQEYSNTNYLLLGMIITEISERPFYEEIFETFNVSQAYPSLSYPPLTSEISDIADLWFDQGAGIENVTELGIGLDGMFSSAGSAGAFVATANDLSKWGYDLYSGNLLSESSMDSLFDYHPDFSDEDLKFGLGVFSSFADCGVNSVGHDGRILYQANLTYYEEYDLSIAVMTNDGVGYPEIGGLFGVTDEIICAYKESLVTSADDVVVVSEVDDYPNPVNDILCIKLPATFDQSVQIEIYNELGNIIYAQEIRNENQEVLQVNGFDQFPKGFYILKIFDADNSYSQKLIKAN